MTIIITNAMKNIKLSILLVGILSGLSAAPAFTQVNIGQLVPEFSYVDTNGETHLLSDYRGKVVFLALIGWGCPFCRAEAPSTETDIWQYYKSDSFQAIALDTWNGSLSQATAYLNLTKITYPLLLNAGNVLNSFGMTYDNYLVVDHQGVLRYSSANNGGLGERYRLNEIKDAIEAYLATTGLNIAKIPLDFNVAQNYPNPFNAVTTINYTLLKSSHVKLEIYDIHGKLLETLINKIQAPSDYSEDWIATGLASGVYFYRLRADEFDVTRKMLLLK